MVGGDRRLCLAWPVGEDHPAASVLRRPPHGWDLVEIRGDGLHWRLGHDLSVIASVRAELDGRRWVHISAARSSRLPSWEELVNIRNVLLGSDARCVQVIPRRIEHINLHPYCLHFFYCLDGETVPDFSRGSGSI